MIPRFLARALLLLPAVLAMQGCVSAAVGTAKIPGKIHILSDHSRAVSALDRGDLDKAQGLVMGTVYAHQNQEIRGQESWGHIRYRAAKIVVAAHESGRPVQDAPLCMAYIVLFESSEGLPDHPDEMLGYMHKAIAMLQSNRSLLKSANPNVASRSLSEYTMQRYVAWQYLSNGGSIDWRLPPPDPGRGMAGFTYDEWHRRFAQAIHGRGEEFFERFEGDQFVRDAIDLTQFPVFVCVAQRKGWKLTPPENYHYDNFRGGGAFDRAKCGQD